MTDRPILFSGPMVRALLAGTKTQTRRVLPDPGPMIREACLVDGRWAWRRGDDGSLEGMAPIKIAAGDRLWVREAWSGNYVFRNEKPSERADFVGEGIPYFRGEIWFWADGQPDYGDWENPRPSIHMPRWASRLTLTVTDVRVQRLQEISSDDAAAEGCRPFFDYQNPDKVPGPNGYVHDMAPLKDQSDAFRDLWDSLNEARGLGWDQNPWVAAYTFTVARQNIDQMEAQK